MNYRQTVIYVTVALTGFYAGSMIHEPGPLFVEAVLTVIVAVSLTVGFLIGWAGNDREEHAVIARAVERHQPRPLNESGQYLLAGRHPIVTRLGDPEDDLRDVPGRKPRYPAR